MDNVERLTGLMEEKADLEALHDINEEMQENARQGDNTHNNITAAGLQSRRRPPPPPFLAPPDPVLPIWWRRLRFLLPI